jgi:hypothetical protein
MKKLPISFHIFETRGQKLATEGLDKLKGRPKWVKGNEPLEQPKELASMSSLSSETFKGPS